MKGSTKEIFQSRNDISEYVSHFTKSRKAKDTFIQILKDNTIKDTKSRGFLCFTEAPLIQLPEMFNIFKRYEDPLYSPYGIGIKKDYFFKNGGRPVIYGDLIEFDLLPKELAWRFELLDPDNWDFS